MVAERRLRLGALLGFVLVSACAAPRSDVNPGLQAAARRSDPLVVSDALEALIEQAADTPADREYAYEIVHAQPGESAEQAFAHAAVTGRLVQQRGLRAATLVGEVERYALRSRELDPDFRDGAATRLLGTLYVIAPAALLEYGDSERGIELLEQLAEERPDVLENRLRLAEAYIALGDPEPADRHLCACLAHPGALRRDDQRLLDQLVAAAGEPDCASTP
jgi:hypothetical protein